MRSVVFELCFLFIEKILDLHFCIIFILSVKNRSFERQCCFFQMAALQSPFYGDKQNLASLVKKIQNCEYPPLPADIYSKQVRFLCQNCLVCYEGVRKTNGMVSERLVALCLFEHCILLTYLATKFDRSVYLCGRKSAS